MVASTRKHWQMVSAYSIIHFLLDFACAFFVFRSIVDTPEGYLCILLYNFCAFAMQMPLGIIADKLNRNPLFAAIGCAFVALAFGLVQAPVVATIIIGIGNAMFHLGGGIDVLNISEKKLGALGVFVSPGAFGVFYGTMLGRGLGFPVAAVPIALLAAAVLVYVLHKAQRGAYPKNASFALSGVGAGRFLAAAACLFLVVCLRSFAGLALDFSWKGVGYWGTALICAVVFGKTIGGFAADRFGLLPTTVVSLGLSALLFLLPGVPVAGVAALLLFNMTMPITLFALAKIMPGAKGFAFGLLAFGLFIGFLPVYFSVNISRAAPWLFALLSAISLVLLLTGLKRSGLVNALFEKKISGKVVLQSDSAPGDEL